MSEQTFERLRAEARRQGTSVAQVTERLIYGAIGLAGDPGLAGHEARPREHLDPPDRQVLPASHPRGPSGV